MTGGQNALILTPTEVARWLEECAEIDLKIAKLGRQKEGTLKKIEAARTLAPSLFDMPVAAREGGQRRSIQRRKGLTTWPHIIEDLVRVSGTGIRQKEMLDQIRSGPYADRLRDSESGYYNGIQKVLKREQLIKRGEWLFTPAQYDDYMRRLEAGEVEDVADETDYGSPSAAAAVRFITDNPGKKSIDVIKAIWEVVNEPRPSKTSLYNTLARLVEQNKIRKDEGGAYHPFNKTEAPAGQAGGASEAGEVDAPPIESRRPFRVIG